MTRGPGELQKLAQLGGIQLSYEVGGGRKPAPEAGVRAVLSLLGAPAETGAQVRDSLRAWELSLWKRLVDPVNVVWLGQGGKLLVRVPASHSHAEVDGELQLEDGECRTWAFRPDAGRVTAEARVGRIRYAQFETALPEMPMGYHSMTLRSRFGVFTSTLIVAPPTSYYNPALAKSWGLFCPVYAMRSGQSWGAGNLSDYRRFSEWAGEQGAAFVGSLPILAGFLEGECSECSPYAPASRLFWNEFFIDVTASREFARCVAARQKMRSAGFQKRLREFRQSPLVDYPAEMRARREILEVVAREFFEKTIGRRDRFETFLAQRPEVEDYARFRAAVEHTGSAWQKWPQRMREGELGPDDFDEESRRYHLFVQWQAQEQVDELLRCKDDSPEFYLDLPLGVHPASYDSWKERDVFVSGATVGAPPDQFFSKGQNWGFAPLHPIKMRQQGYRYLRKVLQFHMRHTGLLRLDHVMALHRLFWIPQGCSATEGIYVRYPAEELYALLCLESHRYKTAIVGENLGTVPPEVNAAMEHHGVVRMHVLEFGVNSGKEALAKPEPGSLASIDTHDTATFEGFWSGDDIELRLKLQLITANQARQEKKERAEVVEAIKAFLARGGWTRPSDKTPIAMLIGCLRFLAQSDAEMLLLSLEDLWLEPHPQNVPGTTDQCPNWRRKSRFTIEELRSFGQLRKILAQIAKIRVRVPEE